MKWLWWALTAVVIGFGLLALRECLLVALILHGSGTPKTRPAWEPPIEEWQDRIQKCHGPDWTPDGYCDGLLELPQA